MTDDMWFKPKTHGYGASPSNWKGWGAIAVFVAIVMAFTYPLMVFPSLSQTGPTVEVVLLWICALLVLSFAFIWVCKSKTDGEWRWRWGEDGDGGRE